MGKGRRQKAEVEVKEGEEGFGCEGRNGEVGDGSLEFGVWSLETMAIEWMRIPSTVALISHTDLRSPISHLPSPNSQRNRTAD
jgi:hypothetical protein